LECCARQNLNRAPQFRDTQGRLSHPDPENIYNWTPADWLQAVVGELGELANELKKSSSRPNHWHEPAHVAGFALCAE